MCVQVLGEGVSLYLSAARIEGDPEPLIPCLLQWVNRCVGPHRTARPRAPCSLPPFPLVSGTGTHVALATITQVDAGPDFQSLHSAPPNGRHDAPFEARDKRSAVLLARLISRAAQTRRTQQAAEQLQERWVAGDAQRKALMDASKMLAQHLDMKELFSGVMVRAKELMEVLEYSK